MKKQMPFQFTWPPTLRLALGILLALTFLGCQSTHKAAGKKLEAQDFTLTYNDKAQAGGAIAELPLQHPLPISERQMVFHMVALTYEPQSLLGKAHPVFTKEDIQKTKRLLTKALNKAHLRNIIGFEIESGQGTTQGELFASGGKLHWRFFEIQGVKYSLARSPMTRYSTHWKLMPKEGQQFHVTEELLGSKRWTNWIEAPINLPAPANLKAARPGKPRPKPGAAASAPPAASPSPPKAAAPAKDPADLEEKLKFLKYLYENQLIDRQEYEKKRKDLLDQYL